MKKLLMVNFLLFQSDTIETKLSWRLKKALRDLSKFSRHRNACTWANGSGVVAWIICRYFDSSTELFEILERSVKFVNDSDEKYQKKCDNGLRRTDEALINSRCIRIVPKSQNLEVMVVCQPVCFVKNLATRQTSYGPGGRLQWIADKDCLQKIITLIRSRVSGIREIVYCEPFYCDQRMHKPI